MATDTARQYRQAKRLTNRIIKKNPKGRADLNQWRALLAMFRRKLNAGWVPASRMAAR